MWLIRDRAIGQQTIHTDFSALKTVESLSGAAAADGKQTHASCKWAAPKRGEECDRHCDSTVRILLFVVHWRVSYLRPPPLLLHLLYPRVVHVMATCEDPLALLPAMEVITVQCSPWHVMTWHGME